MLILSMLEVVKSNSDKAIITLALGNTHYKDWLNYSKPSLVKYCEKNDLNLLVQVESMDDSNRYEKPTWQKLLLPHQLLKNHPHIKSYCYIDTDVIANPYAPSIFEVHKNNTVSLVSQFRNLPFPLHSVLRKIAFNRHYFYDDKYPLDSALFMTSDQIYKHHNLPIMPDYACAGVYMSEVEYSALKLREIYLSNDKETYTLTGGDEPVFNYEIQKNFITNWIEYKYQAIWNFEMAYRAEYLYKSSKISGKLINQSLVHILSDQVFLHFAGSWYEKNIWKQNKIFEDTKLLEEIENYQTYLRREVHGNPVGIIRPD